MSKKIETKNTESTTRDDELLWQLIREPQSVRDESDELREMAQISEIVRDVVNDPYEQAQLAKNASASFAPVHDLLMNAIERDVCVQSDVAAQKNAFKTPRFSWRQSFRVLDGRTRWNWAAAAAVLCATTIGAHSLGFYRATQNLPQNASFLAKKAPPRILPVQSLVDDFDSGLRRDTPFEFVADERETPQIAARRLETQLGVLIHLPLKPRSGAKLLGARRHQTWNRPGVQAHYEKNGVRVAVYQMREPSCSLGDLDEVELNGRLFLMGKRGAYRVVAWRAGDDVMTMVSPLAMQPRESLLLADDMRHTDDFM